MGLPWLRKAVGAERGLVGELTPEHAQARARVGELPPALHEGANVDVGTLALEAGLGRDIDR